MSARCHFLVNGGCDNTGDTSFEFEYGIVCVLSLWIWHLRILDVRCQRPWENCRALKAFSGFVVDVFSCSCSQTSRVNSTVPPRVSIAAATPMAMAAHRHPRTRHKHLQWGRTFLMRSAYNVICFYFPYRCFSSSPWNSICAMSLMPPPARAPRQMPITRRHRWPWRYHQHPCARDNNLRWGIALLIWIVICCIRNLCCLLKRRNSRVCQVRQNSESCFDFQNVLSTALPGHWWCHYTKQTETSWDECPSFQILMKWVACSLRNQRQLCQLINCVTLVSQGREVVG